MKRVFAALVWIAGVLLLSVEAHGQDDIGDRVRILRSALELTSEDPNAQHNAAVFLKEVKDIARPILKQSIDSENDSARSARLKLALQFVEQGPSSIDALSSQSYVDPRDRVVSEHEGVPRRVIFSETGKEFVTANDRNRIQVFEVATLNRAATYVDDTPIHCLAIAPKGDIVASVNARGELNVWHLTTGKKNWSKPVRSKDGKTEVVVVNIEFSHDGSMIATSGRNGYAHMWDSVSGELRIEKTHHDLDGLHRVVISGFHRETTLISVFDNMLKMWSLPRGGLVGGSSENVERIVAAAISRDGQVATISEEVVPGVEKYPVPGGSGESIDGPVKVALVSVKLWSCRQLAYPNAEVVKTFRLEKTLLDRRQLNVHKLQFTADSKQLIGFCGSKIIDWDIVGDTMAMRPIELSDDSLLLNHWQGKLFAHRSGGQFLISSR